MRRKWLIAALAVGAALTAGGGAPADDRKGEKKTGAVVGELTEVKLDNPKGKGQWVKVKGDGEEEARRYWLYGDKPSAELKKQLDACPVGSRVRLTWEVPHANEGPHVKSVELLKKAPARGEKPGA